MMNRAAQFSVLKLVLYDLKPCHSRRHRRVVHPQNRIYRLRELIRHICDMLHIVIHRSTKRYQFVNGNHALFRCYLLDFNFFEQYFLFVFMFHQYV